MTSLFDVQVECEQLAEVSRNVNGAAEVPRAGQKVNNIQEFPALQKRAGYQRDSGYERFALVLKTNWIR